jgi:hypothetical protein
MTIAASAATLHMNAASDLFTARMRMTRANAVMARAERGHGMTVLFLAQWAYRMAAAQEARMAKALWEAKHA